MNEFEELEKRAQERKAGVLLVFKDQFDRVITTIGDIDNPITREIQVYVAEHEDPCKVAEQLWASYAGIPSTNVH